MGANRSETSETSGALVGASTADLVARLSQFEGPPERFLINLLALQCHVAFAEAGAILRVSGEGQPQALAIFPPLAKDDMAPVWLAQAAEQAQGIVAQGQTLVKPLHGPEDLYGQRTSRHLVIVPLTGRSGVRGLAAFAIKTDDPKVLEESCSGAAYIGERDVDVLRRLSFFTLLIPQSEILGISSLMRILEGLRSRWIIPFLWACPSPRAISRII